MNESERLRIVVFGSSIVSEWRNPIASSARPILESFIELGCDVLFLEERNNPWLVGLLKARGQAPVRAFDAVYPRIQHRTFDLPRPGQRTVWFARQVGTVDAILALPGTPDVVLDEINDFRSSSVVRAVPIEAAAIEADIRLGALGQAGTDAAFGPAVEKRASSSLERWTTVVVTYDGGIGEAIRHALFELGPALIDQTESPLPGWDYLPEVELPEWFEHCHAAVVAGDWRDRVVWPRLLAPLASGCSVLAVGPGSGSIRIRGITPVADVSRLPSLIRELARDDNRSRIPDAFDASRQAAELLGVLRRVHDAKRRARR